mgnify:CR=1 FL=1
MKNINQLNVLSREQYHDIWVRINAGSLLDEEEQVIGKLMKQHKEFYKDWDSTVVNQINSNNPKQTGFTYNKLRAQGDSHLDAIHKIASVVLENIWDVMKYGKKFNEKKYIQKLKRITKVW